MCKKFFTAWKNSLDCSLTPRCTVFPAGNIYLKYPPNAWEDDYKMIPWFLSQPRLWAKVFQCFRNFQAPVNLQSSHSDQILQIHQMVLNLNNFIQQSNFVTKNNLESELKFLETRISVDQRRAHNAESSDQMKTLVSNLATRVDFLEKSFSKIEKSQRNEQQATMSISRIRDDLIGDRQFVSHLSDKLKSISQLQSSSDKHDSSISRLNSLQSDLEQLSQDLWAFADVLLRLETSQRLYEGESWADKIGSDLETAINELTRIHESNEGGKVRLALFSRIQALETKISRFDQLSQNGEEKLVERLEAEISRLQQDKSALHSTVVQISTALAELKATHASLLSSGAHLQTEVDKLSLELAQNMLTVGTQLEELRKSFELYSQESNNKLKEELSDHLKLKMSQLEQKILEITSKVSEDSKNLNVGYGSVDARITNVENLASLLDSELAMYKNCCNETAAMLHLFSANLTQLRQSEDFAAEFNATVSELSNRVAISQTALEHIRAMMQKHGFEFQSSLSEQLDGVQEGDRKAVFVTQSQLDEVVEKLKRQLESRFSSESLFTIATSNCFGWACPLFPGVINFQVM